jgi:hypothetical protein
MEALDRLLASADADQLAEFIARANAALPVEDARRIRAEDVHMLKRLVAQADTLNHSMIAHAAERRWAGERRGRVSPEAGNTAEWRTDLRTRWSPPRNLSNAPGGDHEIRRRGRTRRRDSY